MREIGGYIELDTYNGNMLHEGSIALNCGRNALAYLIRAKNIKKIYIPKFLCDSVRNVCKSENVTIKYYSVGIDFLPEDIDIEDESYFYLVNYYGQLENELIKKYKEKYKNIIVDNVQAYFQMPIEGTDTIYTCRKFFGVSDGAFLYTDAKWNEDLKKDESFDRMRFLLGRFEKSASEFYLEYVSNNDLFENEPIKEMSKLTENLLRAIDYEKVKSQRTENFSTLHSAFEKINKLNLSVPEGAFMYPLYVENGEEIRKKLQQEKIYIPTLWEDTFEVSDKETVECHMTKNILPLPCDQRYNKNDMEYLIEKIKHIYMEENENV